MNAREKEQYLREYSILKSQGKPFFPYSILKDSLMAVIVLFVIILMAVLFGAELQPKADPTSTTYSPRPEWYFFFLFELLRVIKPPSLTFMATIGIPTICLVLLLLLPFYDRSPERHPLKRPIAMIGAAATVATMAYLSVLGAVALPPSDIEVVTAAKYEEGRAVVENEGCLACHKIGESGNTLAPDLTHIGDRLGPDAVERTLLNPTDPMPSYEDILEEDPEKFKLMVDYVASLKEEAVVADDGGGPEGKSTALTSGPVAAR